MFALVVYARARSLEHRALEEELLQRSAALAGLFKIGPDGIEWEVAIQQMPEYTGEDAGAFFVMFYPDGRVFGRSPSVGPGLPPSLPEWREGALDFEDADVGPRGVPCVVLTRSFLAQVERDDDEGGDADWKPPPEEALRFRLQVAVDRRDRDRKLAELAAFLGLAGAALIGAAIGAGILVSRRVLRPLRRMTAEAERLTPGDPARRLGPDTVVRELHSLAVTLNRSLDRLGEAMDRQRRFTSDASHELRTPITVLLASEEFLLRRDRTPEEYREGLEQQYRTTLRMKEITENLLTLARADAAADELTKRPVPLENLLAPLCDEFRPMGREKDVSLECLVDPGLTVLADERYLSQLVSNLVTNALKFTPRGGAVRVEGHAENGRAILSVSDTGPGIPPEQLEKVFDRFYRVHEGRDRQEGAGLGLSIVEWIARAHGSEVEVRSEPGEGSTFRVGLPAGANAESDRSADESADS